MSRSLKKGPYTDEKLMKKVKKALATGDKKSIKTWARASTITPEMVGLSFAVHNGRDFLNVYVDDCLKGNLQKGLKLLGQQGGKFWIDQPGGYAEFSGLEGIEAEDPYQEQGKKAAHGQQKDLWPLSAAFQGCPSAAAGPAADGHW